MVQHPERAIGRLLVAGALMLAALPEPVRADTAEPTFFDFNALKERYEREERQRQEDGFVLQELADKKGKKAGRLSFGSATEVEDPYQQFGARTNFRGRTSDEISPPGLNLKLSF